MNYSSVYIFIIIALLFVIERLFPLRIWRMPFIKRLFINLVFSALTYFTALYFVKPATFWAIGLSDSKNFGLLSFVTIENHTLRFVLAFLLLDLSFYYWHVLNHRLSYLWRFHNVHHFDPDLDVTTGARFHPIEVFFSSVFRISQVLFIGVSLSELLIYEIIFQSATFFHHSNIKLPEKWDKAISYFIVTPRMHGIHHSVYKMETNSNYSVVLSIWDRLHKSLNLDIPQSLVTIGVPGYTDSKYLNIWQALLAPLKKQNDYWIDKEGRDFNKRI